MRFFAKRHNYTGGQKKIEDELGFVRPDDLEGVDGKEAISLWYRFLKGDKPALDKLIHYNYNDIRGMIYLFNYIFFNKIYGKTFPAFGNPKEFLIRRYKENVYTEREANKAKKTVSKEVTFFKHKYLKESFKYKIAGIDLTGSEKKASGLAILKGNKVNTALIKSDDDIIKNLLDSKVELVSIDSPLSLPNGRTSVFDDDPKREEIGIMRACERILKRRGVNVYPALIPSMQRLTKRGIELAQKIRRIGIPVIESFPG
ncbi:PF04250 family protein, partial [Fusobacterium sp. CM21]